MDLRLSGQVAIVTGSSRGIGASIAQNLAREGVAVVVNYARDREGAESVRAGIEAEGGRVSSFQADISDRSAVQALVAHAVDQYGRLDILVNNAGAMGRTPFMQTSSEELDRIINTNLKGTFCCCQEAAAHMIQARYGRILNCSSLSAFIPRTGHSVYGATKLALHALTQSLAGELAPYNILVNAYVPGTFATEMARPAIEAGGAEMLTTIGLRRFGKPEDLGYLATFLVSPLNNYMSGSIVLAHGAKLSIQNPMKPWQDAGLL